jgi:hypothetical protein
MEVVERGRDDMPEMDDRRGAIRHEFDLDRGRPSRHRVFALGK